MLADVQIHKAMTQMAKLTLATLEEMGPAAITEERLTSGVYQLVKLQEFTDQDADAQSIYALAVVMVSPDLRQIENAKRLLTK